MADLTERLLHLFLPSDLVSQTRPEESRTGWLLRPLLWAGVALITHWFLNSLVLLPVLAVVRERPSPPLRPLKKRLPRHLRTGSKRPMLLRQVERPVAPPPLSRPAQVPPVPLPELSLPINSVFITTLQPLVIRE